MELVQEEDPGFKLIQEYVVYTALVNLRSLSNVQRKIALVSKISDINKFVYKINMVLQPDFRNHYKLKKTD